MQRQQSDIETIERDTGELSNYGGFINLTETSDLAGIRGNSLLRYDDDFRRIVRGDSNLVEDGDFVNLPRTDTITSLDDVISLDTDPDLTKVERQEEMKHLETERKIIEGCSNTRISFIMEKRQRHSHNQDQIQRLNLNNSITNRNIPLSDNNLDNNLDNNFRRSQNTPILYINETIPLDDELDENLETQINIDNDPSKNRSLFNNLDDYVVKSTSKSNDVDTSNGLNKPKQFVSADRVAPLRAQNSGKKEKKRTYNPRFTTMQRVHSNVYYAVNILLYLIIVGGIVWFGNNLHQEMKYKEWNHQQVEKLKIVNCKIKYNENRCDPRYRLPGMEEICNGWQLCISRENSNHIPLARLFFQTLSELVNSFFDGLNFKAMLYLAFIVFVWFLTKFLN